MDCPYRDRNHRALVERIKAQTAQRLLHRHELRAQDGIESGREFVERLDRGDYRLTRRAPRPNEGVVNWLLSCPEKDVFVPIASESTETL